MPLTRDEDIRTLLENARTVALVRVVLPARAVLPSSGVASTATIAPPAGSACISEPRAAIRAQASSSDSTPATCAAVSSPIECPATRSGVTPRETTSR